MILKLHKIFNVDCEMLQTHRTMKQYTYPIHFVTISICFLPACHLLSEYKAHTTHKARIIKQRTRWPGMVLLHFSALLSKIEVLLMNLTALSAT